MRIFVQFNRLIFGKIALSISNFIILFLLSNYYPQALTGTFYYQVAVLSTVAVFIGLGIDNSLFFFLKKNLISLSQLVAIGYRSLLFFIVMATGSLLLYFFYGWVMALSIIFYAGFIWSCLMQNIFNAYLSGKGQGWKLQLMFILSNICFITCIAANINKFVQGNDFLLYIFYAINFFISLAALSRMHYNTRSFKVSVPPRAILKKILRFGFLPYVASSIFFLGANMDLFLIRQLSPSKLTVYVQAVKIFQMACSVAYLLFYPFMGRIIISSHRARIEILLRASRFVIAGLILLLIPFYLFCYLLLKTIFPLHTVEIFNLLVLLGIAIVATGAAYLYSSCFIAMKRYRQNLISAVIFFVTVSVMCLLLIPIMGVYGGALAYSMAILFSLLFDVQYVIRSVKGNLADAFFLKKEDIKYFKSIF